MEALIKTLENALEFSSVLNTSISASWLILLILIFRVVFRKAPKWTRVAIWGLVAFRLMVPFSIESPFSLVPSAETIPTEILRYEGEQRKEPAHLELVSNPTFTEPIVVELHQSVDTIQMHDMYMNLIWWGGMAVMLLYVLVSYLQLYRKVWLAVRFKRNIYLCEGIEAPFVMGLVKPKIYMPYGLPEQNRKYVIAHEQTHIKRKDHWWKPLGFALLTIHWFNPFMWISYILFCKDIELACDEKVIKELGQAQRADYSEALLACSVRRSSLAACPVAFGETGVKERVKNVLSYKKPAFLLVIAVILAGAVLAVCFLTDPVTDTVDAKDRDSVFDKTEVNVENGFVSGGYENYSDGYSDTYSVVYATELDDTLSDGRIYIEQWYNGECVAGVPGVLSSDMTELYIRMRVSMDGTNGEVTIWSDKDAGEWTTAMRFPESMTGWHYEAYGKEEEVLVDAKAGTVLAMLVFDDGHGIRDSAMEDTGKLENEIGYAVVVRAVFEEEAVLEREEGLDWNKVVLLEDEEKKTAYIRALEQICYERISPTGVEWMPTGSVQFAIYDIDSDGREELLIHHDDGVIASMSFEVYDYDEKNKTLREELCVFPDLTFYDNGMIEVKASHNQGMAQGYIDEAFWPYSFYQYNAKTDTYEYVLNVDAWEKTYSEKAWTGEIFPNKADFDGDGILYYIMTDGEYNYDEPIDGAAYQKWRASVVGEPFEMDIEFIDLPYVLPEAAA